MTELHFSGVVWVAPGDAAWHFVTVPEEPAEIIRLESGPRVGFGSVKVEVVVGDSTWSTSVFPDTTRTYVSPSSVPSVMPRAFWRATRST